MISNTLHHRPFKFLLSVVVVMTLVALPLSTASAADDNEVSAQGRAVRMFFSLVQVTLPPDGVLSLEIDAGLK